MSKPIKISLEKIIKRKIGLRIILFLSFLRILIILQMMKSYYSNLNKIQKRVIQDSINFENFTISQTLVNNPFSVSLNSHRIKEDLLERSNVYKALSKENDPVEFYRKLETIINLGCPPKIFFNSGFSEVVCEERKFI
ncbi:MAG: hypothetical protein K0R24_2116 [Gammaproteobacteria bacterium]|jgi:hypothetical protein|nr:hypothetical protein [Gammaproteobacteria bacterium]